MLSEAGEFGLRSRLSLSLSLSLSLMVWLVWKEYLLYCCCGDGCCSCVLWGRWRACPLVPPAGIRQMFTWNTLAMEPVTTCW